MRKNVDKKTQEYMEKRVKAYKDLEEDKQSLEYCKADLIKYAGFGIRTNNCIRSFEKKSDLKLREAISQAINERFIEIEKEMLEI